MTSTLRIAKYQLRDVIRSRAVLVYGLFLLAVCEVLYRSGGGSGPALLSVMNVVLLVVPLVSLVFGTMYLYGSRDFGVLLLTQPVGRRSLYGGVYLGLALPLLLSFAAGAGLPFLLHGVDDAAQQRSVLVLLLAGAMLTLVFTAIAFLISVVVDDHARGLAFAIVVWLGFAVLYDGLVMLVADAFADHSLERPMIALSLANPVDLARIVFLLRFDVAALMGYTGAVFERFFGSAAGLALAFAALALWLAAPLALGARRFGRRDF
jgi:Cu-processing system permease protein